MQLYSSPRNHRNRRQRRNHADRPGAAEVLVQKHASQRSQLWRQSEHDMDVGRGEQFAAPCLDPAFASARLTLRAMAIAATVIRDGGTMSATGALIDVTAECGGATARNREQDLDMGPADPRSVALNESSSCTAN